MPVVRIALTHVVSPNINRCELTYQDRSPIDFNLATEQHRKYCQVLSDCGLRIIELSVNRAFPDSTFIEDTAVVFDEIAILASMGTASRRGEVAGIELALGNYREIASIELPATLEGGDVLSISRKAFVGITPRTNAAGVKSVGNILEPLGYEVIPVKVKGCLHLKTACTAIDDHTLLVNPHCLDPRRLQGFRLIFVSEDEPGAANCLVLNGTIYLHAGFVKTHETLKELGFSVDTVDISELLKAEAGLTCSSIIFKHPV